MSGLDLAAALQRLRPALPVMITSGYVSDDLLARAAAQGVRHVMLKEYTLERLVPLVQQLLASETETRVAGSSQTQPCDSTDSRAPLSG